MFSCQWKRTACRVWKSDYLSLHFLFLQIVLIDFIDHEILPQSLIISEVTDIQVRSVFSKFFPVVIFCVFDLDLVENFSCGSWDLVESRFVAAVIMCVEGSISTRKAGGFTQGLGECSDACNGDVICLALGEGRIITSKHY